MRVEVHDADPARPHVPGHGCDARERDGVIAAEHDRDRAGARDPEDLLVDHAEPALEPRGHDRRVPGVDDPEVRVRLDVELDRPGGIVPPRRRRHADRARPEAGSGPRGHPLVERCPDDRDVGRQRQERLGVRGPRQLVERAVPVRVVGQVRVRELRELVLAAQLAVLDAEVGCVGHGSHSSSVASAPYRALRATLNRPRPPSVTVLSDWGTLWA